MANKAGGDFEDLNSRSRSPPLGVGLDFSSREHVSTMIAAGTVRGRDSRG